jgi:hypothetical protein
VLLLLGWGWSALALGHEIRTAAHHKEKGADYELRAVALEKAVIFLEQRLVGVRRSGSGGGPR